MTGEYILLENIDHLQPSTSTSGSESKPSEAGERSPVEPSLLTEDSDSFSLDKAFGFVDYDEVSLTFFLFFFSFLAKKYSIVYLMRITCNSP